jgi:hypothetical protein
MKKLVVIIVLLLTAGAMFGQEFTFQGLSWGATREQVVAKLGQPDSRSNNDVYFYYLVSVSGYKASLKMSFWGNNGLDSSSYTVNFDKELSVEQVNIAFLLLFNQLIERYGAYSELITNNDGKPHSWVWHFNNFHISLYSILFNQINIVYFSTSAWNRGEELLNGWVRLPNNGL